MGQPELKKTKVHLWRNAAGTGLFVISILCLHSALFAQTKAKTMNNGVGPKDTIKGITIHQEIDFKASPQELYETLLSGKRFSECTKKSFAGFSPTSAIIDSSVGGTFSVFDGHIIGRILELVPNQRIVEAWRVVDWPEGVYSVAKFELMPNGSGTRLIFDHVGFPEGLKAHLTVGWQQHYWDALSKYFGD